MKEVKITIPDNYELVKEGDSYIVKEKKNSFPRSWEEFCKNYPVLKGESNISSYSSIDPALHDRQRDYYSDRNLCISKEEAEAFLALMQLRQLRKAWVGDWEQEEEKPCAVILHNMCNKNVRVYYDTFRYMYNLSFPNRGMAEYFLSCFKDLCETAKILL